MTDFSSVKGKVAIVTGGADGIGKAIATLYAANGMHVVIADLNSAKGEATAHTLCGLGYDVSFCQTDVSKEASMDHLMHYTVATYGRLDGIVNNAGIGIDNKPLHTYTLAEYTTAMAIDQESVFLGMRYGIDTILKSQSPCGFVINIASLAGITGNSSLGVYSAAKHAVVGMTKCAALDYATYPLTVNCICPGTIMSAIWRDAPEETITQFAKMISPSGRLGTPEDIAYAALFLASDMARYITGTTLPIDGGSAAGKVSFTSTHTTA